MKKINKKYIKRTKIVIDFSKIVHCLSKSEVISLKLNMSYNFLFKLSIQIFIIE